MEQSDVQEQVQEVQQEQEQEQEQESAESFRRVIQEEWVKVVLGVTGLVTVVSAVMWWRRK